MKIESISGCTCDSLTIDGIETVNMKITDIKEVIKKLIDAETDLGTIQSILINLVESRGDFEDLGTCEECGDTIYKYTLKI